MCPCPDCLFGCRRDELLILTGHTVDRSCETSGDLLIFQNIRIHNFHDQ